jgi:hypothetical protein
MECPAGGDAWLPLVAPNLYAGDTFASALAPVRAGGRDLLVRNYGQPVPGVGGRGIQDPSSDSHLPASLISLAGGSVPPANEDMLKRGSR